MEAAATLEKQVWMRRHNRVFALMIGIILCVFLVSEWAERRFAPIQQTLQQLYVVDNAWEANRLSTKLLHQLEARNLTRGSTDLFRQENGIGRWYEAVRSSQAENRSIAENGPIDGDRAFAQSVALRHLRQSLELVPRWLAFYPHQRFIVFGFVTLGVALVVLYFAWYQPSYARYIQRRDEQRWALPSQNPCEASTS